MRWECSECGCRVGDAGRPERCPGCGIAGSMVRAETNDVENEPGSGGFSLAWLELGMNGGHERAAPEP